ncbi:HAMP domain-containing histidine kinase [Skermanella sp. TT6]|uniref:histidine kinase n=1 Tax=Skermanella cutis TaxID=2775420 RepID=A0ABX7B240_9PROT|nr:HAMP domain-containing sensor histidine kinase [Skermanella sp. TT6]QQP87734.1 HAMP domain-containing histidine kinase [Skermanella sp. TT6]
MAQPRAKTGGRWLLRSLASRLVLVSVVFIAVPILIYQQFRAADEDKQTLLLQSAQQQGQLIARALEPLLARADASLLTRLGEELARFADENTRLKLLLRPRGVPGAQGFYYVGAAPQAPNANLDIERQRLLEQGILARLADTCSGNQPLAIRLQTASGALEVLTSITPINSPFGCWAVVTSHSTPTYLGSSIGQPYWQTPEVQAAALIYLAMAALVLLLFLGVWSNLRRFGLLARQIGNHDGNGRSSFAEQNTVPELRSVAEDFDRLVDTLRSSADNLRRAAEDNAHAFKTPIAVIRQSLEPLKRIIPGSDGRGPRAIDMIDRSLDRLDGLVSFARRMDEAAADLLEPPRRKVDLSELLEDMLSGYAGLLAERHLHLRLLITPHVVVRAGEDLLETVVENIVENAISFSPIDGSIQVRLARSGTMAVLTVEDEGPGVDPGNIERIFERYFSQRDATDAAEHRALDATGTDGGRTVVPFDQPVQPAGTGDSLHFGIGLWIVRRNIEAIGGRVTARNRDAGGLLIRVDLPMAL